MAPLPVACWKIEYNKFGDPPRTAVIFWGYDGQVIDWRWAGFVPDPQRVRPNFWEAVWLEQGKLLRVTAERVIDTRTRGDRELAERARLSEDKRRKLVR